MARGGAPRKSMSSAPSSSRATSASSKGELSGYHAALTDAGAAKLDRSARANLQPGVDYKIREEGGEDWLPLGHGALAQEQARTAK